MSVITPLQSDFCYYLHGFHMHRSFLHLHLELTYKLPCLPCMKCSFLTLEMLTLVFSVSFSTFCAYCFSLQIISFINSKCSIIQWPTNQRTSLSWDIFVIIKIPRWFMMLVPALQTEPNMESSQCEQFFVRKVTSNDCIFHSIIIFVICVFCL